MYSPNPSNNSEHLLRIRLVKILEQKWDERESNEMDWPSSAFSIRSLEAGHTRGASYASDRQDGIAQTSRHDTTTGARNSLISVARMHDLPLSVRPVVAVIRRRAFACPSSEPGFTRVTPFRNTAARALPEIGRNYFQQRGPDSFVWLRDRTIHRLV